MVCQKDLIVRVGMVTHCMSPAGMITTLGSQGFVYTFFGRSDVY